MPKIKLTKNELKRQRDNLKMFERYLPTLQLKKQQLQVEIIKVQNLLEEVKGKIEEFQKHISRWVDVFGEDVGIEGLITAEKISTRVGNIAGVDIPIFEEVVFKEEPYDFMKITLWVDYGIEAVKDMAALKAKRAILEKQLELIREELRITTQRVNLFEKVKIPEAKENIRKIQIWLGDLETVAVVRGKIAKAKIQKQEGIAV